MLINLIKSEKESAGGAQGGQDSSHSHALSTSKPLLPGTVTPSKLLKSGKHSVSKRYTKEDQFEKKDLSNTPESIRAPGKRQIKKTPKMENFVS
jgi:hypothetical protein